MSERVTVRDAKQQRKEPGGREGLGDGAGTAAGAVRGPDGRDAGQLCGARGGAEHPVAERRRRAGAVRADDVPRGAADRRRELPERGAGAQARGPGRGVCAAAAAKGRHCAGDRAQEAAVCCRPGVRQQEGKGQGQGQGQEGRCGRGRSSSRSSTGDRPCGRARGRRGVPAGARGRGLCAAGAQRAVLRVSGHAARAADQLHELRQGCVRGRGLRPVHVLRDACAAAQGQGCQDARCRCWRCWRQQQAHGRRKGDAAAAEPARV